MPRRPLQGGEFRRDRWQNPGNLATAVAVQYVWGTRYIDAPTCRDRDTSDGSGGDPDGDCTDSDDEHLYTTQDANFNTTALVDASDGSVVERVVYDPYGTPTFYDGSWANASSSSAYDNEILFCGYRFDPESGLYHVRHRMYHPTLGRWLQRDPLGYVDGMSLYEYVRSAPGLTTDWIGLKSIYLIDSSRAGTIDQRTGKTHLAAMEEHRDAHNASIDRQKSIVKRKKGPFYLDNQKVSRDRMLEELENRKIEVERLGPGKEATLSALKDAVAKNEKNCNEDELIYSTHGTRSGHTIVGGEYVLTKDTPKLLGEAMKTASKAKADKVVIDSCYNNKANIQRTSGIRQGPVAGGSGEVETKTPVTPYDPRPPGGHLNPDVHIHTKEVITGKDGKGRTVRDAYDQYEFRSSP